jgi:RNA 2',3'-cyclic 3'-phosphodiesterase
MQRRIFIGISLPDDVKKRLNQRIGKWKELPIMWSLPENLHLTLSFLGFVDDESLADICLAVKEATQNLESFDIDFEGMALKPDAENPKMIWLFGGANEELRKLQTEIEKSLDIFVSEKKEFKPHINLGKIDRAKWKALPEKPKIEEKYKVSIPVESVDVFESTIEKGRTRYTVLESCELR